MSHGSPAASIPWISKEIVASTSNARRRRASCVHAHSFGTNLAIATIRSSAAVTAPDGGKPMTAVAIQFHQTSAAAPPGLCGTCTNMPGCGFYRGPNPVIHCEEFSVDETPPWRARRMRRPSIAASCQQNDGTFHGICVNCDERELCKLRVADQVVWHCQEYRQERRKCQINTGRRPLHG